MMTEENNNYERKRNKNAKKTHLKAIEEIKEARKGIKRSQQYQVNDDGKVYDEINEEEYEKIINNKKSKGKFVVDDGNFFFLKKIKKVKIFHYRWSWL